MKKLKLMIMGLYLLIVVSATMVSSFESDVTFDYNPTNPEVGEGVTFNIEVINEDNSIVDYEWSFGESGRGTVGTSTSGTGLSLTGKTHWVDTGMDFSEGDILSIEASGTMMFDSDGRASNPDGQVNPSSDSIARVDGNGNCKHLLCGDDVASSALVGRIRNNGLGDYSSGFVVGSDFTKLIGQGGRLYLGYNDGYVRPDRSGLDMGGVGDNSGSFSVTLGRKPGRITHTYSDSGSYNVKLYLMDSNGAEGVITKTITVGTPTDDSEPIQECSDSDDGLNYYRKGITRGPNINGQYLVLEDYCYDGVNGNKVGSGPSLAEFYCLNGDTAYPKYDYICPNGCSDGACLPEEDDAKRDVPPFIIAVSDRASASDVSLMEKLIDELEGQSYDVPSIGVRKLFSEVDALRLNNMVTVAIYQGESVVIVGATSPAEHVLFSYDVMDLLDNYRSMTSGEIRSDSLFDLFIDDEPTPIPIPAPTPRNMQSEPIIGNRNAEVSIIGYMGYNDRFSREAWSTIEQLFDTYENEINFEFRNFPLSFQDPNNVAAIAGECVLGLSNTDTFWEYSDLVMRGNDHVNRDEAIRVANRAGVNIKSCVDNGIYAPEVLDDINDGKEDGARGTPHFVINGNRFAGALSYNQFKEIIGGQIGSTGTPDIVVQNLRFNQRSDNTGYIDFDLVNIGKGPVNDRFAVAVYVDGKITTHTVYNERKVGVRYDDPDSVIPILPGGRFHKSLSNYPWLADGQHTITVAADRLDKKGDVEHLIREGYRTDMIDESRETNNKEELVIGQKEEREVYLDRTFDLREGQRARVVNHRNMEIRLNDIIRECQDSPSGTGRGCRYIGAFIQVDMPPTECRVTGPNEACASIGTVFTLKEGESRDVFGANIRLVDLKNDAGEFLVTREIEEEEGVDISIEPQFNTIKYGESAKYKVIVTDKHDAVVCRPGEDCADRVYTYDVVIRNLPFFKDYPKKVFVGAGRSTSFTLTVRPYEVDKGNIIRNVEVRPTITTAVAGNVVQEMNDVEEDSIEGEIIEIPLPYYQKEYKFNVRVMQSGNPKVQDTAYSVLRIKPREPQTPPEFPRERVEIKLYRGWNLINLPGKLVSFESDSSLARKLLGFVYLKEEQRYVSIKEAQNILGSEFREYLATNAFWVYSYSEHALKVNIDREISFDGMKLSPNWNLIPITEDMVGGYLGDIIGECEFEKLYMWNAPMQEWEKLNKEYVFRGFEANKGIIVKSADYCRLGGVTITAIEPPTMP